MGFDAEALERLLAEREWVHGLARALAGDAAGADDLEQDAWLAALRSPPARPGPIRGWFATVLRRRASDLRRGEARRGARERAAARPESLPGADEAVERAEVRRRVLEALLALEEPGRTTLVLRYLEGLPLEEVASRTGAPLETVRTRIRRALAVLRERLDAGHGGRRERWLPLLLHRDAPPTVPLLPIALAVAASAGAAILVLPGEPGDPPAPPAVAALPPEPAPPAPPPPPTPAEEPAPVAPVPRTGRLELRVSVDPPAPRSGEPFDLVATFANPGDAPVTLHAPEEFEDHFPRWTLQDAEGRLFAPSPPPSRQSMWEAGVVGRLVAIPHGGTFEVRTRVDRVMPGDAPPAPGGYLVAASHLQEGEEVPWSEEFAKTTRRRIPGLWTGEMRSDPAALTVLPADRPALALSGPARLQAGRETGILLRILNGGLVPVEVAGRLRLRSWDKGEARGLDWVLHPDLRLRVEPGSPWHLSIDLGSVPGAWLERNSLWLVATLEGEDGKEILSSNFLTVGVDPPADISAAGLRLALADRGGGRVGVRLENGGEADLRLPARLLVPGRLRISVRRPGGTGEWITVTKGSTTQSGASIDWSLGGADIAGRATPDFPPLRPGEALDGEFSLSDRGVFPPGPYEVLVTWSNVEHGGRSDLPRDGRALVGRVPAPPLVLEVEAR